MADQSYYQQRAAKRFPQAQVHGDGPHGVLLPNRQAVVLYADFYDARTAAEASNQSGREGPKVKPTPAFKFLLVAGALLTKADWQFSGRKETSRRTITASVKPEGAAKMMANWIYKSAELRQGKG